MSFICVCLTMQMCIWYENMTLQYTDNKVIKGAVPIRRAKK